MVLPLPRPHASAAARSLSKRLPTTTPRFTPSYSPQQQQHRTLFGLSKRNKQPKPPGWKPFYKRHPGWTAAAATPLVIVGSLGLTLLGLWAYDASTYHHPHDIKVPVDPLALNPERGGKKNLKIATALVDDLDDNRVGASGKDKKKLVIVGGGWAVSQQSWDLVFSPDQAAD